MHLISGGNRYGALQSCVYRSVNVQVSLFKEENEFMKKYNLILEIINPIIGIIGVIAGSILTSHLNSKKHKNEENKKILRNLYFKIYTELEHCCLTQNGFRNIDVYIGMKKSISIVDVNNHLKKLLEDNIDIIDSDFFQLYHKIKYEQYYNDVTGGIADYEYLDLYATLLKNMITTLKKTKMANKYLVNIFDNLRYEYLVWYSLMKRILDWEKVDAILIQSFLFERSFKKINNSFFINKLYNNKKLNEDEFIKKFEKYCFKKINFPCKCYYFLTRAVFFLPVYRNGDHRQQGKQVGRGEDKIGGCVRAALGIVRKRLGKAEYKSGGEQAQRSSAAEKNDD
jgi:hypothetical protein